MVNRTFKIRSILCLVGAATLLAFTAPANGSAIGDTYSFAFNTINSPTFPFEKERTEGSPDIHTFDPTSESLGTNLLGGGALSITETETISGNSVTVTFDVSANGGPIVPAGYMVNTSDGPMTHNGFEFFLGSSFGDSTTVPEDGVTWGPQVVIDSIQSATWEFSSSTTGANLTRNITPGFGASVGTPNLIGAQFYFECDGAGNSPDPACTGGVPSDLTQRQFDQMSITVEFTKAVVPEPSGGLLTAFGSFALLGLRRRCCE